MKENFLVVDMGTQSLRVSIVSRKGEILAMVSQHYATPYFSPKKGYCEQNPEYYLEEFAKATKEIEKKNPEYFDSVMGLVFVCFRDTAIILDENKRPIRPSILWLDQRTAKLPNMHNLRFYEKILFKLIGMKDAVKYNSQRTVSFWLQENEPDNWKKMRYYVPLTAYINYCMTGNLAVCSADCVGHYPINFKRGKWYSKIHPKINVFGIPISSLPKLVKQGEILGYITEEFSKKTHIPVGLPVYASASDKSCETLGDGVIDKNTGCISLGTACSIDVVSSKYKEPERFLPSYPAPYVGAYDYEVQVYRGLWMISWFAQQFGLEDVKRAQEMNISLEEYLNKKISEIPAGCDGLVLQPYWGPGLKRPNAKGSIIGFSGVHTRFYFYRAMIEGIGFALREGLDEIMKKTKVRPKYLVVSGGGSDSDVFLQIMCDIFNLPIFRPTVRETATLGGAISGYLAVGIYKNPHEAVKNMCHLGQRFDPIAKNAEIYNKLYKSVYLKIYPSLRKVYQNCKDFFLETNNE